MEEIKMIIKDERNIADPTTIFMLNVGEVFEVNNAFYIKTDGDGNYTNLNTGKRAYFPDGLLVNKVRAEIHIYKA